LRFLPRLGDGRVRQGDRAGFAVWNGRGRRRRRRGSGRFKRGLLRPGGGGGGPLPGRIGPWRGIVGRGGLWRHDRKHLSRRRLDDRGLRCLRGYAEAGRKVHLAFGFGWRRWLGLPWGGGGLRRRRRVWGRRVRGP